MRLVSVVFLFASAACLKTDRDANRCTIVDKWSGSFAQDTGFLGNIYEITKIKEIFKKTPTFSPVSTIEDNSNLFLRLSKYDGSMGNHEQIKEIRYLDEFVIIDLKQGVSEMGASVMNQPFLLFQFSEGCKNISIGQES